MSAAVEKHRPGPAARAAARLGGKVPVLDTRRLQLRAPRIYDFDAFAAIMCSDRAVHAGGPFSRAAAWANFSQYTALWLLHGHGLWTIDAQTTPSAGFVVLGYDYDDPEADLAVFLLDTVEGQGFAQEAMTAVRDHAFDDLKWDSVVSCVAAANARGIRLMANLGALRDPEAEAAFADGTQVFRHVPMGLRA